MAWATGAWAGPGSGIKSLAEELNGRCGLVMAEFVVPGIGQTSDAAI